MATIKSVLALEDKMSPKLSKAEKQAIANIKTYNEMSKSIEDIKKALDDAEKANPNIVNTEMYNQASDALEKMEGKLYDVANGEDELKNNNDNVRQSMTELNQTLEVLNKAWSVYKSVLAEANEMIELNNTQFDSQYTMAIKMHTALGATDEEIQSMYAYTAALQQNGIIGDEVLMQGAKQLATSASSTESLKKLTSAAADLAVAEYGIQNAASGYTSVAGYMQRALEGSASMLVRNKILTKQEADYIDSLSSKTEKENALLKAFNRYLGQNEKAAKTAQGQIKQADNAMSDMGETIGQKVTPYLTQYKNLLVSLVEPIVNFITANEWLIPIIVGVGIALGGFIAVLTAYTVVTKAVEIANYALGASEAAALWPILLIIVAIGALIGILIYLWNTNDEFANAVLIIWDVISVGINHATMNIQLAWNMLRAAGYMLLASMESNIAGMLTAWQGLASGIQGIVSIILHLIQLQVNSFIDGVNAMVSAVNMLPGVDIGFKAERATFADNYEAKVWNDVAARQNNITQHENKAKSYLQEATSIMSDAWSDYSAEAYQMVNELKDLDSTRAQRVAERQTITADSITGAISDMINIDGLTDGLDSVIGTSSGGGKAIKTTTDDDLLSDEDIKLLLDVATRDYKLNYQQITPNITLTFGDIRETADVDNILDEVADRLEEIYESNLEVNPA